MTALLIIGLLQAGFVTTSIGDGGSVSLITQNSTVHPQSHTVGGLALTVPPHGEGAVFVQCAGEPPPIPIAQRGPDHIITPPVIEFADGPPALWISAARQGRAALAKRISAVRGETALRLIDPKDLPDWFGAIRFAPLTLIAASTWAELPERHRTVLRQAVASGMTLVIGAGEGVVPADTLAPLTAVRLGPLARPGPAMLDALSRASTRRVITSDTARIRADGQPLLVESAYGLGTVRVLGSRLVALDTGVVTRAAFADGSDRLTAVLDWINAQPGLAERRASPLAPWIWWSLLALLGLAIAGRFVPRLALAGGAIWVVGAALVPPTGAAIRVDASRGIAVPLSETEDLVVGTVDITLGEGGAHVLTGGGAVSLDDARPGGACLLSTAGASGWRVQGAPNARRRLTVFAFAEDLGQGTPSDTLAPGPGRMERLTRSNAIGLAQAADQPVELWRFVPAPVAADPPQDLPAPADP